MPEARGVGPQVVTGKAARDGTENACPEGFVPVRRLKLDELARHQSLKEFRKKHPGGGGHPELKPEAENTSHRYACVTQRSANHGGGAWLNLWGPKPAPGHFSLSQVWVVAGTGDGMQTVEAGWQVYPEKYGHDRPVLFVYWTADGYGETGSYNLDAGDFVQVSNRYVVGSGWGSGSARGGGQLGFGLCWYRDPSAGDWWLYIDAGDGYEALGYYPRGLFGGGPLSRRATRVDFGGEVTGGPSSLQMGSGAHAKAGWGRSAFQKEVFYYAEGGVARWARLEPLSETPGCYSLDVRRETGEAGWESYFFFGGPQCP
jgi:hypothetical protein